MARLSSATKERIRAMRETGASIRQIATAVGVSPTAVFRTLQSAPPPDEPVEAPARPVEPAGTAITLNVMGALPTLPSNVAVHPEVRRLFELVSAAGAADELDVLTVAFKLPVPRCRSYLNVTSAELVRARFDVVHGEEQPPSDLVPERPAIPAELWGRGLTRLATAFERQEVERVAVRDRLLVLLPVEHHE